MSLDAILNRLQDAPPAIFVPRGFKTETLERFLLEWSSLDAALLPGEHLGDGVFACVHLKDAGQGIVSWDATADLGEQVLSPLAVSWPAFVGIRNQGELFPKLMPAITKRRAVHQRELEAAVASFDRFLDRFHLEAFEHSEKARLPRYDEWRPQRLCVHDHLLGVMASRYDRWRDQIQAAGFVTRDHTAYARGAATRGLLLSLLCDQARLGTSGGIAFYSEAYESEPKELPVPHEIRVLCSVLGIETVASDVCLTPESCSRLLVALSGFSPGGRRRIEGRKDAERLALLLHAGIWSRSELESLLVHCPEELLPFASETDTALHLQGRLWHATMAALAGRGLRIVNQVAEEAAETMATAAPVLDERPVERLAALPYGWHIAIGGALKLPAVHVGGDSLQLRAGEAFVLAPLAEQLQDMDMKTIIERLKQPSIYLGECKVVFCLPRQLLPPGLQDALKATPHVALMVLDDDWASLRDESMKRIRKSAKGAP